MNPQAYIQKVNQSVRKGIYNRRIKLVKQNYTPRHKKGDSLAVTYHWKTHDEIRIPKYMPKNRYQARRLERSPKGKEIKKVFGIKRIPTETEALRHELWHIVKPYAKENSIIKYTHHSLPNRLPMIRRRGFDKHR